VLKLPKLNEPPSGGQKGVKKASPRPLGGGGKQGEKKGMRKGLQKGGVCLIKEVSETVQRKDTAMRKLSLHHVPMRHFTGEERSILEREWNDNIEKGRGTQLSMRGFAKANGHPHATLRRELLRGMEGEPLFDKIKKAWFYPAYSAAGKAKRCPGNLSIEERPPEVEQREEFGHWEMDTVVSRHGGRGCLPVLTERKTRLVLAARLGAVTAKAVRKALRRLIRSGRLKGARSITTDNGSEFPGSAALERLFRKANATLRIYYTHAYAAWEKGPVENANRHVRRFFPKGTDFSRVTAAEVAAMQDFINSIPRRHSLKGKTAHEAFLTAA